MYDAKLIQPQRMSVAENNPLIILYLSGILAEKDTELYNITRRHII